MSKRRIWELDAFRGLCILGVVLIHTVYDLVELYGILNWSYPVWFSFIMNWGGILFLLLSGICVTLGSHSVRRGGIVFSCGMVISAVTYAMFRLNFADKSIIIYFGVLHCLGVCMLSWPLFKKFPWWALAALGIVLIALGFYVNHRTVNTYFLMPLGLVWNDFHSSDFFPLLPNLGYFLLGAALGRTLYRKRETLFPNIHAEAGVLRFLQFCGRQSLWIYLLHQPIVSGLCMLILQFTHGA